MVVESLNSGIYPHWSKGYSTIVKIKDINNKPIYVRGTSLPDPDEPLPVGFITNPEQYCTNTMNYYRYVKNIPHIISLHGCGLDWSQYRYKPRYCDNLNESDNWNKICNEHDEVVGTNHIKEFHWVDMSAGFFSVFKSISDIDFTQISNFSIIHCLAGFGRTGTVLMLIICINYYKENPREYEIDFLTPEPNDQYNRNTSDRIIKKLKSLFDDYVSLDQEVPIDPSIPISNTAKDKIKQLIVGNSFNPDKIKDEIFTNFYKRGSSNRQINYTSLNVLVTRINYILYFTAQACGVDSVILYETHEHIYTPVNNSLVMDSLVLKNPVELSLRNVNVLVENPIRQEMAIAELTKRGFDFIFFDRTQTRIASPIITPELTPVPLIKKKSKSKSNRSKIPGCIIS